MSYMNIQPHTQCIHIQSSTGPEDLCRHTPPCMSVFMYGPMYAYCKCKLAWCLLCSRENVAMCICSMVMDDDDGLFGVNGV